MSLLKINGSDLIRGVKSGCIKLEHERDRVDALNVFPVPDGDTGTNMYLTLLSAVKEGEKSQGQSLAAVAKAISTGSLMGARGNSGVILSQVFRGFAKLMEGKEQATALDLALAIKTGANTAYEAVMKPVEGTILTVAREVARAAEAEAKKDPDIVRTMLAAIKDGHQTLQKTPMMLPILKEAGVVDAGGQGLMIFFEGMLEGLVQDQDIMLQSYKKQEAVRLQDKRVDKVLTLDFQYCTETLIKGNNLEPTEIKEHLAPLGDSMLVVGGDELVKVHIHSNHPGKVLESCLQWGSLSDIKINNMLDEVHEHRDNWPRLNDELAAASKILKKIGLVAVGAGSGVVQILQNLGVDVVVEGGQTMNPSIEDILNACKEVQAPSVIVLPNNSNIIMAAEQAKQLSDKPVAVVPSRSVMQAITALIAFNPELPLEEVARAMMEEMKQVKYGEVTYAVRDSRLNGLEIKNGDIIGLIEDKISVTAGSASEAVLKLLEIMVDEDSELITFFYGEDVTEEEAGSLKEQIIKNFPDCEVDFHFGGQPHYRYLLSVE
ncbi:MAG: DAK2 domain-containing protein [Syntrophomonas sp.]|uniref:DAK2 domain-containing protein n=1 Tax=Syntrophomonas sp. TaxID=2053627 RepID=UPI0026198A0B|nr:DAK2 domain-containing protein [Syntrophomonas sp.]MDD2510131.1 DAK2 domain-containing protein [Syntrophomonas sp.]MDD3878534.1 DAK2 domain-containing protein [Syntrophomonas sp.]MDD4626445.1 DAK2 domain-containing protein [Syntrophomonas sp.]